MKLYLRLTALLGLTAVSLAAFVGCGPEAGIGGALSLLTECSLLPVRCPYPVLYVANYSANNVARYNEPYHTGSGPADTYADVSPVGIAVNDKFLVTDRTDGSVTVFQFPVLKGATPSAHFGTSAGGFMAFDPQGNLWATSQNAVVVEYVPPFTNSSTESNGLTDGITDSYGIAFDSSGNVYISNADSSGTVVMYAPPYSTLGTTITVPEANPKLHGLAVDGSQLLVADTANNEILVYNLPLSGNTPVVTFSVTAALGLAVDYNNVLYVSEQGNNKIDLFVPPFSNGMSPSGTLTNGLDGAFGLAVAPHHT
ncbi:MAG TPA: hypothetical protein VMV82_03280 [Candidatus Dormibacteraeota bacterium]|nr:hypothetical protein [Candidatus Dormibacteraeota bacterium]